MVAEKLKYLRFRAFFTGLLCVNSFFLLFLWKIIAWKETWSLKINHWLKTTTSLQMLVDYLFYIAQIERICHDFVSIFIWCSNMSIRSYVYQILDLLGIQKDHSLNASRNCWCESEKIIPLFWSKLSIRQDFSQKNEKWSM